ncbi:MAG: alpha/beta fold hydrolase [Bryobacterales bacterium]|nr:alpha/beta fold hydrolase [Bryobacterales bacterium]
MLRRRDLVLASLVPLANAQQELPDLATIPVDLVTPPMTAGEPAAGTRVRQTTAGYEGAGVHHALYLPTDWRQGEKYSVIVEYAGNGNYRNRFGDVSHGTVEGSNLGYGMSAGSGFIWVCMPYVNKAEGRNQETWWGDVKATVDYCKRTVRDVCARFGGDPDAVILCGFSRGAIACNFIGLHDDEIATLWRGFVACSHYDGVRAWPYEGSDPESARRRLQRLNGRPVFVCHEGSIEATRQYVKASGVKAPFTFVPIPFRNHNDAWTLRDLPERRRLREWLKDTVRLRPGFAGRVAYYVRDGNGPNVVLIPGSWGDHSSFHRMLDVLRPDLRVIIVELPGHGATQPADEAPTMRSLAENVLAVVDALDLKRYYVGGHSIGGMLTIELMGLRPKQVAGGIAMEGWTHHQVQAEAFEVGEPSKRTPQMLDVLGQLTESQRKAFGSVWRQWDGSAVLQSTKLPLLSMWGDRGRTDRPPRKLLRVPDRPNIELAWMAGSGHGIPRDVPEDAARRANAFIAKVESHMYAGPALDALLPVPVETITVYRGVETMTGFNMHPYLAWFDGRFWAIWSCNKIRDLQAGQYVRYATSRDGVTWSESRMLTPSEEKENYRYFARGLWVRNGELIALAARDEAVRPLFGPGLELRGYRWNGRWSEPFLVAKDAINNFAPRLLASGDWMMTRRDHKMRASLLIGGRTSPSAWKAVEVPKPAGGAMLDEPEWWTLPNGALSTAFRDGSRSRRLFRSFSTDGGGRWSSPVPTDFPDAMAKFNVLRLSNGAYAMASCPNPSGKRIPLCLSLSDDGVVFDWMMILRGRDTVYRYAGKDPGYAGYHYPQLLEHGGYLYVIHSENMEDIVLLRVALKDIQTR